MRLFFSSLPEVSDVVGGIKVRLYVSLGLLYFYTSFSFPWLSAIDLTYYREHGELQTVIYSPLKITHAASPSDKQVCSFAWHLAQALKWSSLVYRERTVPGLRNIKLLIFKCDCVIFADTNTFVQWRKKFADDSVFVAQISLFDSSYTVKVGNDGSVYEQFIYPLSFYFRFSVQLHLTL